MIIKGGTVATPVPYKEYVDARVLTASDPNNDGNIVLKYGASVEGGGSGTGGGDIIVTDEQIANAVSNYMANNPVGGGVSSWNDLTDKPFGEDGEATLTEIFDIADVLGNEDIESSTIGSTPYWSEDGPLDDGRKIYTCGFYSPVEYIKPDSEYVVEINGIKYVTAVTIYTDETGSAYNLGDEDGTADKYPFYFIMFPKNGNTTAYTEIGFFGESAPIDVKIYERSGVNVKQLDEKYIPDTIARTADVQTMIDNAIDGVQEIGIVGIRIEEV